jgi:hypothetical protein
MSDNMHSTPTDACRLKPRNDALRELRQTLAAVRTSMFDITGPIIDERAIDRIPRAAFPRAEVHFRKTRVDMRIDRKNLRQRCASHKRARVPSIDTCGHVQRLHPRRQCDSEIAHIAPQGHIGLPVAHARFEGDFRMPNQDEIHASPMR